MQNGRLRRRHDSVRAPEQVESARRPQAGKGSVLEDLGHIIASSPSFDVAIQQVAERIRPIIPFDKLVVGLVDPATSTLTTAFVEGIFAPGDGLGKVVGLRESSAEDAVRRGRPVAVRHMSREEGLSVDSKSTPGTVVRLRSSLTVPLIARGRTLGVLQLFSTRPKAYVRRHEVLAERLAPHFAIAVDGSHADVQGPLALTSLLETESRYRQLVESAFGLFYRYRLLPSRGFEYVSPGCAAMIGYSPDDYYADPDLAVTLVHPDDRHELEGLLEGRIEPNGPVTLRWRRKDQTVIWTEQHSASVRDDSGKLVALDCLLLDITDRKKLEAQLLQVQRIEALGQLAGGIAHDFNNLLTAIIGHSQLGMTVRRSDVALSTSLHQIQRAAEQGANLTRRLMEFTRKQQPRPVVVDLNVLIIGISSMIRRLIGENIELAVLLDPRPTMVEIDPSQMEQVLVNLSVNARDAMPHGGKLTVKTSAITSSDSSGNAPGVAPPEPLVSLTVADVGEGMTEQVKARIFEPFFTTKEPGKGTGLGLSTSYEVIKRAGGTIQVSSELRAGTTFEIVLPRVADDASVPGMSDDLRSLPRGIETVLLVEDEPAVRRAVALVLREQGYTVLEASNGIQALNVAEEQAGEPVDLLLTDVVMPLMGGRELCSKMRDRYPATKVLYTSGYSCNDIVEGELVEPGTGFLEKPFTPVALAEMVRDILTPAEAASG